VTAFDPDGIALIDGERTRTHAALTERADLLVRALHARGLAPGARFAVMLPNSIELFEANRAAARGAHQIVPVNWHLMPDEVAWILSDSGVRVLIADPELRAQVEPAVAQVPGCALLWTGDDYDAALSDAAKSGELEAPVRSAPDALPDIMLYTSGTTGRPKGVVHEQVAKPGSANDNVRAYGLTPADVHLLAAPAYHGAPWSLASSHLSAGASVVIARRWDARRWLALVEQHHVTTAFAVPFHFGRLLEIPPEERARFDLSSLRLIVHGGAPCPVPVKAALLDWLPDIEVYEFYGFTEGGRVTRCSAAEWRAHPGTVGRAVAGLDIKILGPDDQPVATGEVGRVAVRPPGGWRFHYHGDAEKTAGAWFGDYCTAGDLGYLDDEGYLYISDRAHDLILRGGVNIYPGEIEAALFTHPAVIDCAVFGVPDARDGERIHALIEADGSVTAADLDVYLRERIAGFKVPSVITITADMPREDAGKIRKHLLRERAIALLDHDGVDR
jgi:long-chain acyl-CoA synthetase